MTTPQPTEKKLCVYCKMGHEECCRGIDCIEVNKLLFAQRLETLKLREVKELRYAVEMALTLRPDMPNIDWFGSVISEFDALLAKLEPKEDKSK